MLFTLDANAEKPRTIGVGLSPGDHFYAQPYFYMSPSPQVKAAELPQLPMLGAWRTEGFMGAVATAEAIVALNDRRGGTLEFLHAACDALNARLSAA